ncbi:DUF4105 domain-containing protein [Ferrimonas senticii]|uniref:Lnb N-terminal periplasmic domain-containing protein n=1 Tax=Ferrimonas senticii TaxID=394566 RepID=UPI00196A0141|nr:DUF4105 domain-containing protein [Ferrimonas senticii]
MASTHGEVEPPQFDVERLAKQRYWLKLGHYLPQTFGGYGGTVDSAEFYLAANGKYSPQQELQATIAALYQADDAKAQQMRCAFPARYTWLQQQLGQAAELNCPELLEWQQALAPQGLTLVFPTAYMNNPSSMFGHTLLRVDAKEQNRNSELVAYAVNFAAEPDGQDNPMLYAMKGLFGQYPGRYTVMPYYRKVREYNDIESRDIWEYPLKFSEAEVHRILLHLWEMHHAEFDYYFLDENCSYQLLALLELARDDLELVNQFPLMAIPSDTVAALAQADLIKPPAYRESFGTRLLDQAQQLDPTLFGAAQLAKQGQYPDPAQYSDPQRAAILELAYEWLNFELYDLGLERDPTARQLTQLLYQRSRIKTPSPFNPVVQPEVSPERGHGSARIGGGGGHSQLQGGLLTLEGRLAYHDLLDSQQGFIPGAKISFLDTQLSYSQQQHWQLERLTIVEAMALAPSNQVFDNAAWQVQVGFDRMPNKAELDGRWFAHGGYGKAWGETDGLHYYGMVSAELSVGALTDQQAVLGAGISGGVLWQSVPQHRFGIAAQWLALTSGSDSHNAKVTASWHWQLATNWALRSETGYRHWHGDDWHGGLTLYHYF